MPEAAELTDKHGRPLRGAALQQRQRAMGAGPRPQSAAEADALRGRQIEQLRAENRALAEKVAGLERVLGPAMLAPRPKPAAPAPVQRHGLLPVFQGDPDHDPRVVEVILRRGATWEQINAVRRQVLAEYEDRALERQAREDEYFGRTGDRAPVRQERPMPTPPPVVMVPVDENGRPRQVSTRLSDWDHKPDTAGGI